MIIGRVFAYFSLFLLIMFLGVEGLRFLEEGQTGLLTFAEIELFLKVGTIESERVHNILIEILSPISSFSVLYSLLYLWVMLIILFRKRN